MSTKKNSMEKYGGNVLRVKDLLSLVAVSFAVHLLPGAKIDAGSST